MGRRPRPRGPVIDAVLVVDKASGPSSHDCVAAVRRVVGHSRVGHTGTLDPLATGVLICCVGRATRLVPYLQGGMKTYVATAMLGVATDSYDAMGVTTATRDASGLDRDTIAQALASFVGIHQQIPPMVSAVKVDGERLYAKARRGEAVERPSRNVTIDAVTLDDFVPGERATVTFRVTCGPGTYIRTIAHDLGVMLDVGAHLTSLRRTVNGGFHVDQAVTIDELHAESWQSHAVDVVAAVKLHMPVVTVTDRDTVLALTHGGAFTHTPGQGPVAVVAHQTTGTPTLVGIYDGADTGVLRPACVLLRPEELS
ncbi:MAG: tRNA pseudouridine(55) synthase TruB [Nitriliruptoraceae bacterium]